MKEKHFSTWADKILQTYPIGPEEITLLSDFDQAMAQEGLGTSTRHAVVESFLQIEAVEGRRFRFRKMLMALRGEAK